MKASNKSKETHIIEREVWWVLALQLKKTFWKSSFSLCHGGNEASSFIIPVYEQPVSRFRPAWRGAVRADTLSSPSPALPQEKVQSCRSPLCRHTATLANSYIITFFKAFFFFLHEHRLCCTQAMQQVADAADKGARRCTANHWDCECGCTSGRDGNTVLYRAPVRQLRARKDTFCIKIQNKRRDLLAKWENIVWSLCYFMTCSVAFGRKTLYTQNKWSINYQINIQVCSKLVWTSDVEIAHNN